MKIPRELLTTTALGIAETCGKERYLNYQNPLIRSLTETPKHVLKLGRQTGKTVDMGYISAAYLSLGIDVQDYYPSLRQGYDLLLRETAETCRKINLGVDKFSMYGLECANGARVHVGSTDEGYRSSEGYTIGGTFVDEGHRAEKHWIGELYPSMKVMIEQGFQTMIIAGVDGLRDSLIEVAHRERGFKLNHLTAQEIIAADPEYQITFDELKDTLSDEEFRKYVLCEGASASNRAIFFHIGPIPERCLDKPHWDVHGIDVGQMQDNTVFTQLRYYPSNTMPHLEVIKTWQMSDRYDIQMEKIKDIIYTNGFQNDLIGVETNGVGRPIFDFLSQVSKYNPNPISRVRGFHVSNNTKKNIIEWLQTFDRGERWNKDDGGGRLCCRDETMRSALDGLERIQNEAGKVTYTPSDYLSSLVVAGAMIGYG